MLFTPSLIILLAWVATTVFRLYFPEKMMSFEEDPLFFKRRAIQAGETVPVGVLDIYEDQQRLKQEMPPVAYCYEYASSNGWPEEWEADLWMRRN